MMHIMVSIGIAAVIGLGSYMIVTKQSPAVILYHL